MGFVICKDELLNSDFPNSSQPPWNTGNTEGEGEIEGVFIKYVYAVIYIFV